MTPKKPDVLTLDDLVEVLNEAVVLEPKGSVAGDVLHALRGAAVRIVDVRKRYALDLEQRISERAMELMTARQPHQLHAITGADCYAVARLEITGKFGG